MPKPLGDYPSSFRQKSSAMDELPQEIYDQIFAALQNKTHSVPAIVWWLREEYGDEYEHISASMIRQWWGRRRPRGVA